MRIAIHPTQSIRCCLLPLLLLGGCSGSESVQVVQPHRGVLQESFAEPARTRLARVYPVGMPLDGRIARIELEAGDAVTRGQPLVVFDRLPAEQEVVESRAAVAEWKAALRVNAYNDLEATFLSETTAVITAASEVLKASELQVQAEQAQEAHAALELGRMQELVEGNTASESQLDDAQLSAETSLISLRKEQFNLAATKAIFTAIQLGPTYIEQWLGRKQLQRDELTQRLLQAEARLVRAQHGLSLARVVSPIDGIVLERHTLGDGAFPAGSQLLLLGDLSTMEVVVEVLTRDALRIEPGVQVELDLGTLAPPLLGQVSRIEPSAFTKLSSLGIEQQRVKVIVNLDERPARLGAGYRLQARFLTQRSSEALIVPRSSVLQAPDGSYYCFVVENKQLVRRTVALGLQSDLELEVTDGLSTEDTLVLAPDALLKSGDTVRVAQ